jgi:hypothetical protein
MTVPCDDGEDDSLGIVDDIALRDNDRDNDHDHDNSTLLPLNGTDSKGPIDSGMYDSTRICKSTLIRRTCI